MEKYLIMVNEITSRKKLSQKEIEQNRFKQFESTTIYETNNKTEDEEEDEEDE